MQDDYFALLFAEVLKRRNGSVFTVQTLNKAFLPALYRDRFPAAEFNESLIFWS